MSNNMGDSQEVILEEVSRHIAQMEIVQLKELLWKKSVEYLISEYQVKTPEIFTMVERDLLRLLPKSHFSPSLQDALVEFRIESKGLITESSHP